MFLFHQHSLARTVQQIVRDLTYRRGV